MIKSFLKNDPDLSENSGMNGIIRLISVLILKASVLYYLVTSGLLLPLYLPGYRSIGSDKAFFWVRHLKVSLWIFLAGALLYLISGIIGFFGSGAAGRREPDRLRSSFADVKGSVRTYEIWTVLFAACVSISCALSEYKDIAFTGETNWYIGLRVYLAICLCIIVIGRAGMNGFLFAGTMILASFLVSAFGVIIDVFGEKLDIDGWSTAKMSSIGNTNWFCGYMVCVLFVSAAVYMTASRKKKKDTRVMKILCMICFVTGSYCFFSQGSSSAYPAALCVFIMLLTYCGRRTDRLVSFSELLTAFSAGGLLHAAAVKLGVFERANDGVTMTLDGFPFLLFLFAASAVIMFTFRKMRNDGRENTGFPIGKAVLAAVISGTVIYMLTVAVNTLSGGMLGTGPVLYFGDAWASNRGITMSAGLTLFKGMTFREKLFGTGPDTFYSLLVSGRYPALDAKIGDYFGGARLTNAHCEPLTMLVNTGIAGTVSFYGMLICLLKDMFRCACAEKTCGDDRTVYRANVLAASVGIAAYMVNDLFSFQTAMNLSQLSLLAGFGIAAVRMLSKTEDE